jgi:hypothetical protein
MKDSDRERVDGGQKPLPMRRRGGRGRRVVLYVSNEIMMRAWLMKVDDDT